MPPLSLLGAGLVWMGCAPTQGQDCEPPDQTCAAEAGAGGVVTQGGVRPGVDVLLSDSLHLVLGKRVGLITNQTGIDRDGRPTIDRLFEAPGVDLVALFSPEHGIRGAAQAGVEVDDSRDAATGLPIHSLYGATRRPTPATLRGLDVLVFDIQDVGARYYTYVSTMAEAMVAAGEVGLPVVVLDRPNPIGGTAVQGGILDPAFASFVGLYPVPMRHGMTPGELARLFVGEFGVEVDLTVVPLQGWERAQSFPETGLPWIAPSPNMPSVESALHYPGTCLFEGTNLSVGRGTVSAFQQVGAPWLDGVELARRLNAYGLPDTQFRETTFTPNSPGDGKYDGETARGVRFLGLGPDYDPTIAALAALIEVRALAGDRWEWRAAHFDRLAGSDRYRSAIDAGADLPALVAGWSEELQVFRRLRSPYLLYD